VTKDSSFVFCTVHDPGFGCALRAAKTVNIINLKVYIYMKTCKSFDVEILVN